MQLEIIFQTVFSHITAGTQVIWQTTDGRPHTVTFYTPENEARYFFYQFISNLNSCFFLFLLAPQPVLFSPWLLFIDGTRKMSNAIFYSPKICFLLSENKPTKNGSSVNFAFSFCRLYILYYIYFIFYFQVQSTTANIQSGTSSASTYSVTFVTPGNWSYYCEIHTAASIFLLNSFFFMDFANFTLLYLFIHSCFSCGGTVICLFQTVFACCIKFSQSINV